MKICPTCGEKTNSKFCPECGRNLADVEIYKCPKCGSEIEEIALFCPECGARIDTMIAQDQSTTSQEKDDIDSSNIEIAEIDFEDNNVSLNDANEVNGSILHPESVITVGSIESADNTEVASDTPTNSISNETNNSQSDKKPKKKTIGIIIGIIAVLAVLSIMVLGKPSGPKVDHYSINYYTPYDGDSTASIDDMDLIAVYDNEEEATIDKSEWYISDPAVFTAPTTDITIRYNNEDLYFTINVNEATPEPEPEAEPEEEPKEEIYEWPDIHRELLGNPDDYVGKVISAESKVYLYKDYGDGTSLILITEDYDNFLGIIVDNDSLNEYPLRDDSVYAKGVFERVAESGNSSIPIVAGYTIPLIKASEVEVMPAD